MTDYTDVEPLVAGCIQDWAALTAFLNHVIYTLTAEEPSSKASEYPVVLIVPPQWSLSDREKITKIFLEDFLRPAFMIIDSAVASLYACNTMTGLVIDIGHQKTDIVPIVESMVMTSARSSVPIGGAHLTEHFQALLRSDVPLMQETQSPMSPDAITIDLCEEIKRSQICEVQLNTGKNASAMAFQDTTGESEEGVLDIAAVIASGKTRDYLARVEAEKSGKSTQEIVPNAQLTHNTVTLSSQETLVVGQARFKVCDPLLEETTLLDAVYEAIMHPSIELHRRKDLWENLVIVGGGSKVKNFREKLVEGLQLKYASHIIGPVNDPYTGIPYLNTYPSSIRLLRIPIHFPEWNSKEGDSTKKGTNDEGTFLGAQIMAHIAFSSTETGSARLYITKNDYMENGPPGVHL